MSESKIRKKETQEKEAIFSNLLQRVELLEKEDFSKIDDKVFLDAFLKNTGAKIPEKIIEGIHFNEKYPEYKNIYISDINREKVMIHNGKDWFLTPSNNITSNLLDKTIHFSENKYETISEKKRLS